jgi:tetratricopeptide (TPR) repeat protein
MTVSLADHLAPALSSSVMMPSPERRPFSIHRYKGFISAVRLLFHFRKNKQECAAEEAYNEALKAHSIGSFPDAERAYNQCLVMQPDHEPARTNLAALYIRQNSFELAEEQLKRAIQVRPFYPRAYYNLGLLQRHMNRPEEAAATLERAISMRGGHTWAAIALAELHVEKSKFDLAVKVYRETIPRIQDPRPIWDRLAQINLQLGDLGEAENCLRESLAIKEMPMAFHNLGWVLAIRGEATEEARDLFRQAVERQSNLKEARYNLALTQSFTEANAASVKNMSHYVKTHVSKETSDLIEHLEKLLQVNPRNDQAYLQIAGIYLDERQPRKAVEILERALKVQPDLVPALLALANGYYHIGHHKEAIQTYIRLIKAAPEEVEGYLGLARAYAAVENYLASIPVLEKVLELDPNNAEIHYQYGTIMAQEGEFQMAYKHYKTVATLDPNFPRIEKRLRMLEEELEEGEEIELWPKRKSPG